MQSDFDAYAEIFNVTPIAIPPSNVYGTFDSVGGEPTLDVTMIGKF